MPLKLTLLVAATLASLTVVFSAQAQAFTLGAADGTPEAAPLAKQLGARTYRLVMDSRFPLESYAPRIEAFRAMGMRPQIVVDGTGTEVRGKHGRNWQTINYAVHAVKRWPDAYSVSVMNEPNMSGISVCQYAKTYRRAYRMLKRAGAQRVLFGEFAPTTEPNPLDWTAAAARCTDGIVADGWAWHCYDHGGWYGINKARVIAGWLKVMRKSKWPIRSSTGRALQMYCTEYGALTRGDHARSEHDAARSWGRAFNLVRRWKVQQIVAWGVAEVGSHSKWDTSVFDANGNPRRSAAVIASAR
jgi:hypothetical protein